VLGSASLVVLLSKRFKLGILALFFDFAVDMIFGSDINARSMGLQGSSIRHFVFTA
jgi:hypothetical protein